MGVVLMLHTGLSFATQEEIPDPNSGIVELKFAWPVGLSGIATTDLLRIQRREGKAVTSEVTDETSFVLEPDNRGLLVRFTGIKSSARITPEPPGGQGAFQKLVQVLSTMQPSYVVSPGGKLVDVVALDEFRKAILARFAEYSALLPEDRRPRVKAILMKQFTKEQLLALISQDWNRYVGQWVGAALRLGTRYRVEGSSPPIALLGNVTLPGRYVFGATRRVRCDDDASAIKCVQLRMTSELDPEKTAAAMRKYVEEPAKQMGGQADIIKSVKMNFYLTLVTEPSTLIPHDATTITRTAVTTITPGGKRSTSYDTRSVTVHYHYK